MGVTQRRGPGQGLRRDGRRMMLPLLQVSPTLHGSHQRGTPPSPVYKHGMPMPSFEGCHGDGGHRAPPGLATGKPHTPGGSGPAVGPPRCEAETVSWVWVRTVGAFFYCWTPGNRSHADVDDAPRDISSGQQFPNAPIHCTPRVHTCADAAVSGDAGGSVFSCSAHPREQTGTSELK